MRSCAFLAAEISCISVRIAARSRRVFGRRDFPHLGENRGEILATEISLTHRDLATISCQYHAAISAVISARCRDRGEMRKSRRPKNAPRSRRDSRRDRGEISVRSHKNFHKGRALKCGMCLIFPEKLF